MNMKAIFPLRHTWESQPMDSGSHKDTKAIDFGVLQPYNDKILYAPFNGKIVYVDSQSNGGGIAFESTEKVQYADGTYDYMTLWTGHDNKPPKVGKTFKQGEAYSKMGTAGGVSTHCHLEVIKGKFKMATKITSQGSYKFDNTIEPYKALYLTEDTIIKYSDYKWVVEPKIELTKPVERDEDQKQLKVLVDLLRVRENHSTNSNSLGYATNGGVYNDLEEYYDGIYTWHKIADNQWLADDGSWLELYDVKDYKTLYEEEKKVNEELKNANQKLSNSIDELNKTISEATNKLKQINELSK